jgi:ATP:cob(I)alamin adenosyltransferase
MHISTKKGDMGYTSTLSGERIPKFDLVIEATGAIDEANSFLGLARASTQIKRIKRIILLIQKKLFVVGAELSVLKSHGKPPKKRIIEADVKWVENLVEELEEALALPPGFVAFGQEKGSSQLDVARTGIRKAERIIAKMKNKDLLDNLYILQYMNRLSDLTFLLACLEEKSADEKRVISRKLFGSYLAEPGVRKLAINSAIIIMALTSTIILLLIYHKPAEDTSRIFRETHQSEMNKMHGENSAQ